MASEVSTQQPMLIYQEHRIDSLALLRTVARIENILQACAQGKSKPVIRFAFKTQHRFLSALFIYTAAVYGRTVLPVANYLSATQQIALCKDASIDLLISDDDINDVDLAVIKSDVFSNILDESIEVEHDDFLLSLGIHKKFQLIIATSGTTAKPKLVLLSRANIMAHVKAINLCLHLTPDDRWLNCLPFTSVAGVMILFRCMITGAGHIVVDEFDEANIWPAIVQGTLSHLSVVPIMLGRLLDVAQQQVTPATFKMMLVGGDQVSNPLFEQVRHAGWPVVVSYGMSETTSTVALSQNNHSYQLLDGFQMTLNDQGAIMLKGPAVMADDYINNDSGERVLDQQGWLTTRDTGETGHDGFIIHGRLDNSFTSGGQTLSIESAEQQLVNCPFLKECRLSTVKHNDWGDTLVAFVHGDIEKTENWCRHNLPSVYMPRFFFSLDQLPVNDMGKILHEKLHKLVHQLQASNKNTP